MKPIFDEVINNLLIPADYNGVSCSLQQTFWEVWIEISHEPLIQIK